jgi:hypothetical protein
MSAHRLWLTCVLAMVPVLAPADAPFDAAKAFGALGNV